MTLDGYSGNDRDLDLEIGHVAGLRWFNLQVSAAGCSGGQVTYAARIGRPTTMECSCGSYMQSDPLESGRDVRKWLHVHRYGGGETRQEPVLSGAYGAWQPGENVASHIGQTTFMNPHTSPPRGGSCHCGFWAYWKLGSIMVSRPAVVGLVHGYGHVIDGDLGFRSSHAALKALFVPTPDLELQLAVEARYQVPVYNSLPAMLAMHPAPEGQPELSDGGWEVINGSFRSPPDADVSVSNGSGYAIIGGGGGGGSYAGPARVSGGGGYASGGVNWTAVAGVSAVSWGGSGGSGSARPAGNGSAGAGNGSAGGGWNRAAESPADYARRIGMTGGGWCPRCGSAAGGGCWNCTDDDVTAAAAAAAKAAAAAAQQAEQLSKITQDTIDQVQALARAMSPIDALAKLDERKATWEGLSASYVINDEIPSSLPGDEKLPDKPVTIGGPVIASFTFSTEADAMIEKLLEKNPKTIPPA